MGELKLLIDFLKSPLREQCKDLIRMYYMAEENTWALAGMQEAAKAWRLEEALQQLTLQGEMNRPKIREFFVIRESEIDTFMKHYRELGVLDLTYERGDTLLKTVLAIFEGRESSEEATPTQVPSRRLGLLRTKVSSYQHPPSSFSPMSLLLYSYSFGMLGSTTSTRRLAYGYPLRKETQEIIKEDLLESMELYEKLHGKPHPRRDAFSKM